MDNNQVEQLLMVFATKIPATSINMVREKLLACPDATMANVVLSQLKDPTIALILSICIGCWGVDRFYIGDIGLGIGKLITGGGCGIWWLIDIFLIMDATRQKNLQAIMMQL